MLYIYNKLQLPTEQA